MSGETQNAEPGWVVVALGSNLGDSRRVLRDAFISLQEFARGRVLCSSLWRSAPEDCPAGSPDFLNAVAAFLPVAGLTPGSLLARLQALERGAGRMPKVVMNEPRPLDLDLIAFAGTLMDSPELTLPHPRARSRRFVLEPLAEVLPGYTLPGTGRTVEQLLERLPVGDRLERTTGA